MDGEFDFRDHVAVTEVGPFRITTAPVNHPVEAYAIRVEAGRPQPGLQRRHRPEPTRSSSSRAAPTSRCSRRRSSSRVREPAARPAPDRERRRRSTPAAPGVGRLVLTHLVPWTPARGRRSPRPRAAVFDAATARRSASLRVSVASTVPSAGGPLGSRRMTRSDGRAADQLRPVTFQPRLARPGRGLRASWSSAAPACCAPPRSPPGVPRWRKDSGLGWVTGEYAMLPRATNTRNDRESVRGKVGGRTHEISRLVGRSLRAAIDLSALGENSIVIDCDVLQADGGTRTAAITGAYVALVDAIEWARGQGPREAGREGDRELGRGGQRRHRRRRGAPRPALRRRRRAPTPT